MKVKPIYALLLFVAVVICARVFVYTGHFGIDEIQYAEIAARMLRGEADFDNHFTFRFTVIAATALSYKLFGINDVASSLPAMLLTVMMLVAVYAVLRKHGFWPTVIGLAMTTTSQWILFYSNKLMPDIYVAFFTVVAVYVYYRYRYEAQNHTVLHAVAFVFALFFGFMSKGTVVLLLPWLLYLFLTDCLQKKGAKFWKWAIVSGAICLVVYFASVKLLTGEFLYRFKAIAQNSYLNRCSYDQQPLGILLKRLYCDFFDMAITRGMMVPMVFVLAAFITKGWRGILRMPDPAAFFAVSALLLFLSSNFMTISATAYVPMCVDPRHYLFFVPVAAVAAALFIRKKPSRIQLYLIVISFLSLSVYTFFVSRYVFDRVYLPITIVVVLVAALQNRRLFDKYMAGAMLLAMSVSLIILMLEPSYQYNERRDTLIDRVVNNREYSFVIADPANTRMMRYYDGFTSNERYIDYTEMDEETVNKLQGCGELVVNYHTLALKGKTYKDLPDFAYNIMLTQTPEFDDYGLKLYKLDSPSLIRLHYDTLFSSMNHFDGSDPEYWSSGYALTQKTSCSGTYANRVDTYSASFSYPIDSLRSAGCDTIYIKISSNCNCYAKTSCAIVISIEKDDCTLDRYSSEIGGRVRAYSHWFPFDYTQELRLSEFPEGAVAKVYFFKTDKTKVYVDDFGVSFCKRIHQHS